MKWIADPTGRFEQRPHFEPGELDSQCDSIVSEFLVQRIGAARYPITTDDLTVLLERRAGSLDVYADLSAEGSDVEGVTAFIKDSPPEVKISGDLQLPGRENRLRTTLTHELGHVVLHTFLWEFAPAREGNQTCHRDSILGARDRDWMEWQAGYASGAFLVPSRHLQSLIGPFDGSWPHPDSDRGQELIQTVCKQYRVSADAARVRLAQLRYLLPAS